MSWTIVVHNQLNKLYCRTHVKLWSFFIWCIYTCSYFICHILYSYLNGITKDFLHVFPSDYVYLSYRKSTNKHPSPVSLIPTFQLKVHEFFHFAFYFFIISYRRKINVTSFLFTTYSIFHCSLHSGSTTPSVKATQRNIWVALIIFTFNKIEQT